MVSIGPRYVERITVTWPGPAPHEATPDEGPYRRQEQQEPEGARDVARNQQQDAGQQQQDAVGHLLGGHPSGRHLQLGPPPHGHALALDDPGTDQADQQQQPDGVPDPDRRCHLYEDGQLHKRNENDQKHEQPHASQRTGQADLRAGPTACDDRPVPPPSVDAIARSLAGIDLPPPLLVDAAREAIAAGDPDSARARAEAIRRALLRPVVNATGVLLHTNLGRAPLGVHHERDATPTSSWTSRPAGAARATSTSGGCWRALCGAEAAIVVNNNAAAVLLVLAALAAGREVAVSRVRASRSAAASGSRR